MDKTCISFTYLCFILLRGDLNICGLETDCKLTGLCCSSMDVLPSMGLMYKRCYAQNGHRNVRALFSTHVSGFRKNKLGVNTCAPHGCSWLRTHSFSWSEKSNEVNKDFKLFFSISIYTFTLNIPLSFMEISTEISLHKVITQELKLNYMNWHLLWMRLITFPVAWYVLMTASAIIIHIYTKLQISCNENYFFSKNNDQWCALT